MIMACNLAVSIRDVCDLPITLISDLQVPDGYFDEVITPKPEHMYRYITSEGGKGFEPGLLKLNMDKYTPYENTVYVDADSIFLSEPDIAFNSAFTAPTLDWIPVDYEGRHKQMIWAKMQDIAEYLGGDMPAINSSLLMFTREAKPIFELARQMFPRVAPSRRWGNGRPDELYFNIALSHYPGLFTETELLRPAWSKTKEHRPILTLAGSEIQIRRHWRDVYKMRVKELGAGNGKQTYGVNWAHKFVTQ